MVFWPRIPWENGTYSSMKLQPKITTLNTDHLWRARDSKASPNKNSVNRKKYKFSNYDKDQKYLKSVVDYSLANIHSLPTIRQIIFPTPLILGLAIWLALAKGIWIEVTVLQPLGGMHSLSSLSASTLRKTCPRYKRLLGSQIRYMEQSYPSCLIDPSLKQSHPGWPMSMRINNYCWMPLISCDCYITIALDL